MFQLTQKKLYWSFTFQGWVFLNPSFKTMTSFAKNVVIFLETILRFLQSRMITTIYNDIAQKHGNVTVKDFRKYEKLKYKQSKLKLELIFSTIANNLAWIQNSLSLNFWMFQIKMLYQYIKFFYPNSYLLLISASSTDL